MKLASAALRLLASSALTSVALTSAVSAQDCAVAFDINQTQRPFDGQPNSRDGRFVQSGSFTYFWAITPQEGQELWRTDGTATGTILLRDITPGPGSASDGFVFSPGNMVACQIQGVSHLFFAARSIDEGYELWITDGTTSGTRLVRDIYPGSDGSRPSRLTAGTGVVFFSADDAIHGFELWSSNGTTAGTILVQDVIPGPDSSFPTDLFLAPGVANALYFAAGGSGGRELHLASGPNGPASLLLDVNLGFGSSSPKPLANLGNTMLFAATTGMEGRELWATDGTAAGTRLVRDINPGAAGGIRNLPGDYALLGNELYFRGTDLAGTELWATDGTTTGTRLVADYEQGPGSSSPAELQVVNDTFLVFSAAPSNTGAEPHVLIGNTPTLIADLQPGVQGSRPEEFTAIGTNIAVVATQGGARSLIQLNPTLSLGAVNPTHLTRIGSQTAVFAADGPDGRELWISDGSVNGTTQLIDIGTGLATESSDADLLGESTGDRIFFTADDGASGPEPWSWMPGSAPVPLGDLEPGPTGSNPAVFSLTHANTYSIFAATTTATGREYYRTDGTSPATLLRDIAPGPVRSSLGVGHAIGDQIVFPANDIVHGFELWITDGTTAGTNLLIDLVPGTMSSSPRDFHLFRGKLYFAATTSVGGYGVWTTDGTANGTIRITTVGFGSSRPNLLGEFAGALWFTADTPGSGAEFWRTDGTTVGTSLAFDFVPGPGSFGPGFESFAVANGLMIFDGNTAATGREIFVSDGTLAGTRLLLDIIPGFFSSIRYNAQFTRAGTNVFFIGDSGAGTGRELWVTDMTTNGTRLVRDIRPGIQDSDIRSLFAVGDRLYFVATSADRLNTVWTSEGSTAEVLAPCGPRVPGVSGFFFPVALDGVVYAAMDNLVAGIEIHAITNPGAMVEDLGGRCPVTWSQLESSSPVLGSNWTIQGIDAPVNQVGFTLVANGDTARINDPQLLSPGCFSHAFPALASLPVTTTSSWQQTVPIPADPNLLGVGLKLQTYYLPAPNVRPISTSNALRITIGR